MQSINIYVASRTEEENLILRRRLESLNGEFRGIHFVGLHPQGLPLSTRERITVVVINVTEWNQTELKNVHELRSAGYIGPILVIAKVKDKEALRALQVMQGAVFLEKPFITRDLVGIVRKMLMERSVAQRIHRRFETEEPAEVQICGSNDRFSSWMFNLSKGGAYLEFMAPAPLRAGDMVRMTVEIPQTRKVYTLPARIVWTHRNGTRGGSAAGVEFVGIPDIKKTMVEEF